jgi:hypothetical protein
LTEAATAISELADRAQLRRRRAIRGQLADRAACPVACCRETAEPAASAGAAPAPVATRMHASAMARRWSIEI